MIYERSLHVLDQFLGVLIHAIVVREEQKLGNLLGEQASGRINRRAVTIRQNARFGIARVITPAGLGVKRRRYGKLHHRLCLGVQSRKHK